jgi:hypothetical protein
MRSDDAGATLPAGTLVSSKCYTHNASSTFLLCFLSLISSSEAKRNRTPMTTTEMTMPQLYETGNLPSGDCVSLDEGVSSCNHEPTTAHSIFPNSMVQRTISEDYIYPWHPRTSLSYLEYVWRQRFAYYCHEHSCNPIANGQESYLWWKFPSVRGSSSTSLSKLVPS